MLIREITYTDYNNDERTDTVMFNLSKPEIIRFDLQFEGGLQKHIEKIVQTGNNAPIMEMFESMIRMAYGEKSDDGRSFLKTEAKVEAFMSSAAYEALYMELLTDETKAAAFFNAILPNVPAPTSPTA